MSYCVECGKELQQDRDRFCVSCGAPVQRSQPASKAIFKQPDEVGALSASKSPRGPDVSHSETLFVAAEVPQSAPRSFIASNKTFTLVIFNLCLTALTIVTARWAIENKRAGRPWYQSATTAKTEVASPVARTPVAPKTPAKQTTLDADLEKARRWDPEAPSRSASTREGDRRSRPLWEATESSTIPEVRAEAQRYVARLDWLDAKEKLWAGETLTEAEKKAYVDFVFATHAEWEAEQSARPAPMTLTDFLVDQNTLIGREVRIEAKAQWFMDSLILGWGGTTTVTAEGIDGLPRETRKKIIETCGNIFPPCTVVVTGRVTRSIVGLTVIRATGVEVR